MLRRPLLVAILASPLFVPVSCTAVMLPVAHALSFADVRDVAGGELLHRRPLLLPVVDRADPRTSIALDVDELPAALVRWPGLDARLPAAGNTAGHGQDRLFWRVLADDASGQLIELRHDGAAATHTVRYRVEDGRVRVLSSRLFSRRHGWMGFAIGLVVGVALMAAMRQHRTRARAAPLASTR